MWTGTRSQARFKDTLTLSSCCILHKAKLVFVKVFIMACLLFFKETLFLPSLIYCSGPQMKKNKPCYQLSLC